MMKVGIRNLPAIAGPVIGIAMFCVALWFLHRELADLSRNAIADHIRGIPLSALLASVAFTGCSYLILTGYDATALRYLDRKIPYRHAALVSFIAYAVGHSVGYVAFSGGSIRYSMYTRAGLSATEIARIIVFVTLTFALGAAGLLGVALLLAPAEQLLPLKIPSWFLTMTGMLMVAVPIAYLAGSLLLRRPLTIGSWRFSLPTPTIAITQVTISLADMACTAATLYVLLQPVMQVGFPAFLGIYLLALGAGIVSGVPGGIGVFEAVLIAAMPQIGTAALLGTIVVYRLIYYALPLSIALLLVVVRQARRHSHLIRRTSAVAIDWFAGVAPLLIATAVFLVGVVLLLSGASPAVESRLQLIARALPLPLLELSHLAGSLIGVALLVLAQGLYKRLRSAYVAALIAFSAGAAVSLLKGLDYEEATFLCLVALATWMLRAEFYRAGSIVNQRLSRQLIAAVALTLSIVVLVGFYNFRQVDYSHELWWQFAFDAQAPRMLRAIVVVAVGAMAFALWKMVRSSASTPAPDTVEDSEQLRRIVLDANRADANLALLGDKRLLWSEDRAAFIMYRSCGNSWVALGEPVGPVNYHRELAWRFLELVDRHDGRAAFYRVPDNSLALYVDIGLALAKIGEDARVSLDGFTLQGSRRAELRHSVSRAKRGNASFEVVPRAQVPALLADLRRVSDRWLAAKSTSEKSFSLGAFSESYVSNFDCAVVRVDSRIVAFANLWTAPAGSELAVDLMRFDEHAPKGVMDFLFAELMTWSAASGYRWFNLGMAPLSGLDQHALAPLWNKMGQLVFSHAEDFYNFEGIRRYKDKFDPDWAAQYLAYTPGWRNLPLVLVDVARLISGGTSKIVTR